MTEGGGSGLQVTIGGGAGLGYGCGIGCNFGLVVILLGPALPCPFLCSTGGTIF